MKNTMITGVGHAHSKRPRAMIGNMFFEPIEAIPSGQTKRRLTFMRVDNGRRISFSKRDIGKSVFVEYFIHANLEK